MAIVTSRQFDPIMDQIKEEAAIGCDLRSKINRDTGRAGEGVSCDEAGCVTQMADGAFVTLALRPDALADDCERAALVVTARQAPPSCPSPVIDQDRLRRQGPMALRRARSGFAVDAVRPRGLDRPWLPAAAGDTEAETILAPRPAIPLPADATPPEADQQMED
jgi:competence protein ComEC